MVLLLSCCWVWFCDLLIEFVVDFGFDLNRFMNRLKEQLINKKKQKCCNRFYKYSVCYLFGLGLGFVPIPNPKPEKIWVHMYGWDDFFLFSELCFSSKNLYLLTNTVLNVI
jgi:hypothetical protein